MMKHLQKLLKEGGISNWVGIIVGTSLFISGLLLAAKPEWNAILAGCWCVVIGGYVLCFYILNARGMLQDIK